MLDLQQLKYFVAVAQSESIARAAEQLHISQSPLSRQVIALEARLGLALFARSGKRLKLNAVGQRYLLECKALLSQAAQLEVRAHEEAAGHAGVLAVGYVESAVHAGALPQALLALKQRRPDVRVQLHVMRTMAQFDALRQGEIDIGFTHRAPVSAAALMSQRVVQEPFLLAVPAGHPLAKAKSMTARALHAEPFVFVSQAASPEGHAALLAACGRAGFEPDIRHEVTEPSIALGLIAAGLGLAIVQASLKRAARPGVRFMPLPARFGLKLEVHAVTTQTPSALAQQLFGLCPVV
jgi:DNA-binding transcriptional LysR family regulator